jgi:SAM-dependent methyltransferase
LFGGVAAAYERARPAYPDEALPWLVPSGPRVIDVGAGTGKLTRQLAAAGYDVVAVEPSRQMLDELRRVLPDVEAHEASAESLPLPDGGADAVVCGQSFHWFDTARAVPELARVLRADGTLGLIWNILDPGAAWHERLAAIVPDLSIEAPDPADVIATGGLFGPVERRPFSHTHVVEPKGFAALASSWSAVATLPEPERGAVLDAVRGLGEKVARDGRVELPYVAHAFRAARL